MFGAFVVQFWAEWMAVEQLTEVCVSGSTPTLGGCIPCARKRRELESLIHGALKEMGR